MSEWLKEHAWKVCKGQPFESSNLSVTAIFSQSLASRRALLFLGLWPKLVAANWYKGLVQMSIMATFTKHPNSGIYYFRMAVPKHLRPIIGKREFKTSLRTKERNEAKLKYPQCLADAQQQIQLAELKLSGKGCVELDQKDCAIIAERWYLRLKDYIERTGDFKRILTIKRVERDGETIVDSFGLSDTLPISESEIERATPEQLDALASELKDEITEQLDIEGIVAPEGSKALVSLAVSFYPYIYRLESVCRARFNNNWSFEPIKAVLAEQNLSSSLQTKVPEQNTVKNPISLVVKQFVKSETIKHKGSLSRAKTLDETSSKVDLFIAVVGDMDISKITRNQVVQFRDTLYQMPRSKKACIRNLSVEKQIELAKAEGLEVRSNSTVKNFLRQLSTVFTYAVEVGLLTTNPVQGVRINQSAKKTDVGKSKGYSERDIARIFQDEVFHDSSTEKPYGLACFWIPILCYYTGARLNEIAQLHKSNVGFSEDGIYYLNVRRGEGQSVKTDSSLRHVPVPKHVLELDFMAYVKTCNDWLFPEIPVGTYGSKSSAFGKWWRKIINRVGVTIDQPSHAFRHSIKTTMRGLGIEDSVIDSITGHAPRTEGDRYGSVELKTKQNAIDSLPRLRIDKLW